MQRLFLAILPRASHRAAFVRVQNRLDVAGQRVRWTPAEQMHLTVKFIGDTPTERVAAVVAAVDTVARNCSHGELEVGGLGCFPSHGGVRVVWVGASDPSGHVGLVVQEVEDRFARLGIARESRTFSEHFTIGRVKSDMSHGRLRAAIESTTCAADPLPVREVVLFESRLTPSGPNYHALHRASLRS